MKPLTLLVLGNGGHTKDIMAVYKDRQGINSSKISFYHYAKIYYLDDDPDKTMVVGANIGEQVANIQKRENQELRYIIGINSSKVRREIAEMMDELMVEAAPPLIHKTAIAPPGSVGNGSVMGPYAVLSADATIGRHVHMNVSSSVNQGSTVGDYSTLSPGTRVCGDCRIGEAVQFGANSTVINLKDVGNNVILGAGAVVTRSLPDNVTAVGVPAKALDSTQRLLLGYTI